jgi:hypothetical protein
MNSWFTVKVKYTRQLENGTFKRVSEPYLLAAMSFTDAEARIYEELGSRIRGEFNVVGIARTELHDIFVYDDADTWYKCKITYEKIDEDGEKNKKISQQFLVSAHSVKDAFDRMQESMGAYMIDFEIPSITVSPIVEIFPFNDEGEAKPQSRIIEKEASVKEEIIEDLPISGNFYSAPGSDVDDEIESEIIDEHDADEE